VRGGESFVETCPECGKRAKFVEVEISESFGLFFVDVVGDKERAFRCSACGETFDLKEKPASAPAPAPAKSAAELERERARAEQQRRETAEAKAVRIEDELAELKKRLGR
jgi:rubredoxin